MIIVFGQNYLSPFSPILRIQDFFNFAHTAVNKNYRFVWGADMIIVAFACTIRSVGLRADKIKRLSENLVSRVLMSGFEPP